MYVYVIGLADKKAKVVKIGRARDPEKRLKQLQTGHPGTLEVKFTIPCSSEAHAVWLENSIHKEFEHLQVTGEWFKQTVNLRRYLEGIKESDVFKQDRALERHHRQVGKGHFNWKKVRN